MRKYFDGKQSDLSHTQEFLVAIGGRGTRREPGQQKRTRPQPGTGPNLAGSTLPGPEHVRPNYRDQVARPAARGEPNQPGAPAGVIDPHGPTAPGTTPTPHATGGERRQVTRHDGQTPGRVFVIVLELRHGTREQVDAINHDEPPPTPGPTRQTRTRARARARWSPSRTNPLRNDTPRS